MRTYWLGADVRGSTCTVCDADGQPAAWWRYDCHGTVLEQSARGNATTLAARLTRRYTAQVFDAQSGLYHYGARLYDDALGRFVAVDARQQTPNPYAYCGNDPIDHVDPDGRMRIAVVYYDAVIDRYVLLWQWGTIAAVLTRDRYARAVDRLARGYVFRSGKIALLGELRRIVGVALHGDARPTRRELKQLLQLLRAAQATPQQLARRALGDIGDIAPYVSLLTPEQREDIRNDAIPYLGYEDPEEQLAHVMQLMSDVLAFNRQHEDRVPDSPAARARASKAAWRLALRLRQAGYSPRMTFGKRMFAGAKPLLDSFYMLQHQLPQPSITNLPDSSSAASTATDATDSANDTSHYTSSHTDETTQSEHKTPRPSWESDDGSDAVAL